MIRLISVIVQHGPAMPPWPVELQRQLLNRYVVYWGFIEPDYRLSLPSILLRVIRHAEFIDVWRQYLPGIPDAGAVEHQFEEAYPGKGGFMKQSKRKRSSKAKIAEFNRINAIVGVKPGLN